MSTAQYQIKTFTVKFYATKGSTTPLAIQTVNYGTVPTYNPSLTGWTFVEWRDKSGDSYGQPITQDSEYTAFWNKEYDNLLLQTTVHEPTGTSTLPSTTSQYNVFPLDTTSNLALPTGGTVEVGVAFGLIQHDGSSTTHHLSVVPGYLNSNFTDSTFTAVKIPTETYTVLYDDRDNPEEETTVKTTVSLPMSSTKTDYSDWNGKWGNLAPMSEYDSLSLWTSPESAVYSVWSSLSRYRAPGTDDLIASNMMMSASIDFDKESGSGSSIRTFQYDTSSHITETYRIPSTINGLPANRLALCLIKNTEGCTVHWRVHFYKLLLQLW